MHEDVWRRAGFEPAERAAGLPPGHSDEASIAMIRELCADVLGGHEVFANNSRWTSFTTVAAATWQHGNVVLLGDAAHTAHFSIGSGTKLAMEDALALAACLHEQPAPWPARWPPTRTSGGRWSPPPSGPRRPAWSGSRTSASTPTRIRTSSRSTS